MRDLVNYHSKPQDRMTKILWIAAGADDEILKHCSYSDHVKYAGMGAIVIFTALLASFSAGFAFYTIFSEKRDWALENASMPVQWGVVAASIAFAIVWGVMIFNLDRFIVSSSGKGDGKEGISKLDFKTGWPRMLLALIIGVVISAPLEVKIMEKEINAAIQEEQRAKDNVALKDLNANFYNQNKALMDQISNLERLILEKDSIAVMKDREAELQASGKDGRAVGEGPGYRNAIAQANAYRAERDRYQAQLNSIKQSEPFKALQDRLKREQDAAKSEVYASAGLIKRISVAHDIGGPIPWIIMAFFIVLELTPVFTKMMLVKSPYDYLEENLHEIIKARQAIEIRRGYMKDENGKELTKPEYYTANQLIREQEELIKAQEALTTDIIKKYLEREQVRVNNNLDNYLQVTNPKNHEQGRS